MANLICYIPFMRNAGRLNAGCLRTNADELLTGNTFPITKCGTPINNVSVVYLNEELHQVGAGDVLVVHAHGGDGDTVLADNVGNTITQALLLARLGQIDAEFASEIYFFACFSAMPNHIAPTYKTAYNGTRVFGTDKEAQGSLVTMTSRHTVRNAVWNSGQLREITQSG